MPIASSKCLWVSVVRITSCISLQDVWIHSKCFVWQKIKSTVQVSFETYLLKSNSKMKYTVAKGYASSVKVGKFKYGLTAEYRSQKALFPNIIDLIMQPTRVKHREESTALRCTRTPSVILNR